MDDIKTVKVWKITHQGVEKRVATIEQNGRHPCNCEGCSAPCCKGALMPILSEEELFSRKYKTKFIEAPDWLKEQVPRAEYLAVLDVDPEQGCPYHDWETNKCTLWPNPPKACLSYSCYEEKREDIRAWLELGKRCIASIVKN